MVGTAGYYDYKPFAAMGSGCLNAGAILEAKF